MRELPLAFDHFLGGVISALHQLTGERQPAYGDESPKSECRETAEYRVSPGEDALGADPLWRGTVRVVRVLDSQRRVGPPHLRDAFLDGRGYVVPQDVKDVAMDVLRHRVIVTYEAEAEDKTSEDVIQTVLDHVPVP